MSILSLKKFGVAFGDRIILRSIDLEVPDRGVFVLLGPAGTGKSTLLRTICGINDAVSTLRVWGQANYLQDKLGSSEEYPMLVAQNARLMMATVFENIVNDLPERQTLTQLQQKKLAKRLLSRAGLNKLIDKMDTPVVDLTLAAQRQLAIARSASAKPKLLCIDEPTANLKDFESASLLKYIQQLGEQLAIILVLHNQNQVREIGGQCALLAGGWIHECKNTKDFFSKPQNEITKGFIRTGSCPLPSADAKIEELDEHANLPTPPTIPKSAQNYVSDSFGPRSFLWLKKGLLAGTPRPGIVLDEKHDLKALQRVGIKVLVSLTTKQFDPELLKKYGIEGLWLKIPDMAAPKLEETVSMCKQVFDRMSEGMPVAYHCKAGLGRTGTLLAAQLIWEGKTALDALEAVRRIEPRWVQSEEQVAFLESFADFTANSHNNLNINRKQQDISC
ncbi:hypothetical protein MNBD_GAMMA22-2204 [hydrothermal vent metagenome]|uniref:ABC transporter domain-containing protein n=1 Tax=hydrothermal vent metagenome TaxID=652676 RepID=A0A3B1ANL4_9ZZZZ